MMKIPELSLKRAYPIVVVAAIIAVLPFLARVTYVIHILIILFIYMALAMSWNLLGGYAGQINLGHAAFFGIGGYTNALLYISGVPAYIGIIAGGAMASLFALGISPCFRLRGPYFAVGTLGLTEAIQVAFLNVEAVGGASGLRLPLRGPFNILEYYYGALVILGATALVTNRLINSKSGMAFRAIRENEDAAASIGICSLRWKMFAFAVSALFAGITGGFYGYYVLYVEPTNLFSFNWTFNPIFIVIIGGMGTFLGPTLGSVIFVFVSELTTGFGEISSLIFGALLIAVVILFPTGTLGAVKRLASSMQRR